MDKELGQRCGLRFCSTVSPVPTAGTWCLGSLPPALPIPLSTLVLNHTLTDDSLVFILPVVGGQILPLMLRLWAYFESLGPFDVYINFRISLLNSTHNLLK